MSTTKEVPDTMDQMLAVLQEIRDELRSWMKVRPSPPVTCVYAVCEPEDDLGELMRPKPIITTTTSGEPTWTSVRPEEDKG